MTSNHSRPAKDNQDSRPEDEHLTLTKIMNDKQLRELDAWIAEHVMGYRKATKQELDLHSRRDIWWVSPDSDGENSTQMHPYLPLFTADPAAAMMVLEKCLSETKDAITMAETPTIAAHMGRYTVANEEVVECAETLPLAICLFAKKLFDPRKL
jgi:hypothetical protein